MATTIQASNRADVASGNGAGEVIIDCKIDHLYYGKFLAVRDSYIPIFKGKITAFNGVSTAQPLCAMSVFNNVAFGLRLNRYKGDIAQRVEEALRGAALWDEMKDQLKRSGLSLSGGQQQRLCIARAIATEPAVRLMDEPCSALDPIATQRIEELMHELKKKYTIAVVTHNLQQAMRVADKTAFLYVDTSGSGRTGYLVEYDDTTKLFEDPKEEYTKQYIRGKFS
jgi:phosphate transport system ATP-binding protein